jgi:hypothetical protein
VKPPIRIIEGQIEGKPSPLVVMSDAPEAGVEPKQILGTVELRGSQPAWDTFRPNRTFLDFLASYLRGELGADLGNIASARVEPGERFYVIDPRTADPGGEVPPTDIVGVYDTDASGRPLLETFRGNPSYRVVDGAGAPSVLLEEPQLASRVLGRA